jgi:hypothetical protein
LGRRAIDFIIGERESKEGKNRDEKIVMVKLVVQKEKEKIVIKIKNPQ